MRVALAVVVPIIAALLQGSVAPLVSIAGARPSFPVLVAGSWSVAAGPREAIWWAFVGGLATDLVSGGPLGAFALAALAPVALVGVGERASLRPTSVPVGALLVATAALGASTLYLGLLALTGEALPPLPRLAVDATLGAAYTGALALAAYPLARLVHRGTEKQRAALGW